MPALQLLYKYMKHLQRVEDSSFLELINTPFSNVHFSEEEISVLREMESSIIANHVSLSGEAGSGSGIN